MIFSIKVKINFMAYKTLVHLSDLIHLSFLLHASPVPALLLFEYCASWNFGDSTHALHYV